MFSFKTCTPNSLAEVRSLLAACDLPYADIDEQIAKHFLLAMCSDGELMGAVGVEKHEQHGLLRSLAVVPQARNKGLGKQLVSRAEISAKESGIDSLYLLTTTAEAYFRRLNYLPTDRDKVPTNIAKTSEFTHLCPDSAICLRKSLG